MALNRQISQFFNDKESIKSVKTGWHKVCNIISERRFKKRTVKNPKGRHPKTKNRSSKLNSMFNLNNRRL